MPDFDVEGIESLGFGRRRVPGQTADEVPLWGLGQSSSDGTALIRLAMRLAMSLRKSIYLKAGGTDDNDALLLDSLLSHSEIR